MSPFQRAVVRVLECAADIALASDERDPNPIASAFYALRPRVDTFPMDHTIVFVRARQAWEAVASSVDRSLTHPTHYLEAAARRRLEGIWL